MAKKGYTTKVDVEAYLGQDVDVNDTLLDSWIAGVENIIDGITGRNFIADSEAVERVFDGDDTNKLLIDDAVSISKVEIGNDGYGESFSEVPSTGANKYFLLPNNYELREVPIFEIILNANTFITGKQNQKITGKWGYSAECPEDVSFACTVFVAGIINQRLGTGDKIKSEKIGNYDVTYVNENGEDTFSDFESAKSILDQYKVYKI